MALEQFHLLAVPLGGDPGAVGQLGQPVQSLLQPLHVLQQLCDLHEKPTESSTQGWLTANLLERSLQPDGAQQGLLLREGLAFLAPTVLPGTDPAGQQ